MTEYGETKRYTLATPFHVLKMTSSVAHATGRYPSSYYESQIKLGRLVMMWCRGNTVFCASTCTDMITRKAYGMSWHHGMRDNDQDFKGPKGAQALTEGHLMTHKSTLLVAEVVVDRRSSPQRSR